MVSLVRPRLVMQQFDPDTPRPILKEQLRITRELVQPTSGFAIGTVNHQAWQQTEEIMRAQKQLDRKIDLKAVLRPVAIPSSRQ